MATYLKVTSIILPQLYEIGFSSSEDWIPQLLPHCERTAVSSVLILQPSNGFSLIYHYGRTFLLLGTNIPVLP